MNDEPLQHVSDFGKSRSDWRPFTVFFIGFFLAIPIVLRSQPFNDPGALWHIRVGDWILEHRAFPHTDPFTWSYADRPWVPQQWGAEVLMSFAHRLGGFDALLMGMSALLAAMAAAVAVRFLDAGLHWMPTAAIVSLGLAVAGFHFYLRPHLISIAFMALVMMWLIDFERGRIGKNCLFWMVPLCAVWTNLHGGVLGGIFTYAIAVGGWTISRNSRVWPDASRISPWPVAREGEAPAEPLEPQVGRGPGSAGASPSRFHNMLARDLRNGHVVPWLIIAACLLATLINPFGIEMHRIWWSIVGSNVLKEYISEHQPLSLMRSDGQAVVGFGCFYLLMLAGTLPRRPRVTSLLPVVWFVLSLTSIRHGPLCCATALVALADLLPETVWFRLLKKYGDTFAREPSAIPSRIGWQGRSVVAATILLSLSLEAAKIPVPVVGYGWARFDPNMVPIELVGTLQEYAETKPAGFPIFNDANLGGFLIYFTPSLKVFMDDRCELYGDAGINDYVNMANDHPERIEEWAEKAPFDRALVQSDSEKEPSEMDRYLKASKLWREVARCQKAVLYERLIPHHRTVE